MSNNEAVEKHPEDSLGGSGPGQPIRSLRGRPNRVTAVLGQGRSVIVVGHDLDIDEWLSILQEAIAKGRRAKSYGLKLEAFVRMLRDMGSP